MKITRQFMLAIMMCGFLGASFAHAKEQDRGKIKLLREDAEKKLYKELGLSDEQRKQMEDIKQSKIAEVKGDYNQMMNLNKQLNEELMKEKMDMDRINDLNAQIKVIQGKMLDVRVNSILDIRKSMTPEQFKQFVEKAKGARERYLTEHQGSMNK